MKSVCDLIRETHEELERLEQFCVDELLKRPRTHKEKISQEHLVKRLLEKAQEKSIYLDKLINDSDNLKRNELDDYIETDPELGKFYKSLKEIKEYHRRNPNELVQSLDREIDGIRRMKPEEIEVIFSGEEGFGRYLDLHSSFEQYVNLVKDESTRIEYMQYLDIFSSPQELRKKLKKASSTLHSEYFKYVEDLKTYLEGFFMRSQPLLNLDDMKKIACDEFEERWKENQLDGWNLEQDTEQSEDSVTLFCVPCGKQFSNKSVYNSHLEGKKHKKAADQYLKSGSKISVNEARAQYLSASKEKEKALALSEFLVSKYGSELERVIEETKSNIERKQSRTFEEREDDVLEEEEIEIEEEEENPEDEEFKLYNPLKLPLGWDGKPIPFWLYKLHGLGVEYPCEICGNYVYMGRKAFERHFSEWRHSYALKCLGILNSKHFYEITNIEDALALWEKLKATVRTDFFQPDTMEEYEDDQGNVYNKRTFEDLKRQGIL